MPDQHPLRGKYLLLFLSKDFWRDEILLSERLRSGRKRLSGFAKCRYCFRFHQKSPQITQISQIKTNQKRKLVRQICEGIWVPKICGRSSSSDFEVERWAFGVVVLTLVTRHSSLLLHLVPNRPQIVEDRLEKRLFQKRHTGRST